MPNQILIRPDGRAYHPSKAGLRACAWENSEKSGVIVFGTLNPEAARRLAQESAASWFGDADSFHLAEPTAGWWRDGYDTHGRSWIEDAKRGAPGVMFTWAENDAGSNPAGGENR